MASPFDVEDGIGPSKPAGPSSERPDEKQVPKTSAAVHMTTFKRVGSGRSAKSGPSSDDGSLPDRWRDEEWKKKQKTRLEKEMDVELQKVRADSAIEREEAYDNICNSKDRTQSTAIIAIFILEVAILKDLIIYNPDRNTFFYIVFGFLMFGVVLTVVAGFLLIAVYNVKAMIRKMGTSMVDAILGYGTFTISKNNKLFSGESAKSDRTPLVLDDAESSGGLAAYLKGLFWGKEETLEDRLLMMYKKFYVEELQATLDFAHNQSEAGKLDRDLVAAAEVGDFFQDPNYAFPQEYLDDDQSLSDAKLKSMLDSWHHLKSLRKQGSTLLQRAMAIRRRKLFGQLLNLQNWVTHLLFSLCLVIIVAIAFGITLNYENS